MGLKSLQLEAPGRFWKSCKCKRKEGLNMAWPEEKTSELKVHVVFGSPSAAIFRLEITACIFFWYNYYREHENSSSKWKLILKYLQYDPWNSIPAHPRNQHPGSTEPATVHVSSFPAQGRKLRTNCDQEKRLLGNERETFWEKWLWGKLVLSQVRVEGICSNRDTNW